MRETLMYDTVLVETEGPHPGEVSGALFSGDRSHRFTLFRRVNPAGKGRVAFVMLNPSTADALQSDPTVRRCVGFAESWGAERLAVVNLFSYRATDPAELRKIDRERLERHKGHNLTAIREAAKQADLVVLAWGNHGGLYGRSLEVLEALNPYRSKCSALAITKEGHPGHPLYLSGALECFPVTWGVGSGTVWRA